MSGVYGVDGTGKGGLENGRTRQPVLRFHSRNSVTTTDNGHGVLAVSSPSTPGYCPLWTPFLLLG